MICQIADFNIEFKNPSSKMRWFLKDYKSEQKPEFSLSVTDEDIAHMHDIISVPVNDLQAEAAAFYDKLITSLPQKNALFLHASLIEVENIGIAFTALSGVGKSTHTLLWQKLLGERMQIINGDKPIIRFIDEVPFGYGTPWNGKENFGTTGKTPLKHICFIERSDKNSCEQITPEKALERIFNQIFIPKDPTATFDTLELLNKLLNYCTIWNIKCNTDIEAAQVAYNAIFKE